MNKVALIYSYSITSTSGDEHNFVLEVVNCDDETKILEYAKTLDGFIDPEYPKNVGTIQYHDVVTIE